MEFHRYIIIDNLNQSTAGLKSFAAMGWSEKLAAYFDKAFASTYGVVNCIKSFDMMIQAAKHFHNFNAPV